MEEKYGSARHIMGVYDKAVSAVLPEQKLEVRFACHEVFVFATGSLLLTISFCL